MDPALIAILALLASALQVALLRVIDYYFPRGHNASDDKIAETQAERHTRHKKQPDTQDEDYELTDEDDPS